MAGAVVYKHGQYTLPAAPRISDLSEFHVDINKIALGRTTPKKPFKQLNAHLPLPR